MTVKELREFLENIPGDTVVSYRDGNFGGPDEELTSYDLDWYPKHKQLLIRSPYWEAVD